MSYINHQFLYIDIQDAPIFHARFCGNNRLIYVTSKAGCDGRKKGCSYLEILEVKIVKHI